MGGKKNRQKRRKRSDECEDNGNTKKAGRFTSTKQVSVSEILSETNTVLYDDDAVYDISLIFEDDTSVEDSEISQDTTVDKTEFSIL